MPKITITGGSLNGNSGAEAMLVTIIGRVREIITDCDVTIFTPYYSDDRIVWNKDTSNTFLLNSSPIYLAVVIFPLSIFAGIFKRLKIHFLRHLFPKPLKQLWESNALVDIAGISFNDKRIKYLPFNVLSIIPAIFMKVPVFKFAQALGPFQNGLNRFFASFILSRCETIFARGEKSYEHLQQLQLKTNIQLAPDIAFLHSIGDALTENNIEKLNIKLSQCRKAKHQGNKIIGVCPSTVVQKNTANNKVGYVNTLTKVITNLMDRGYYIVLYPNATKEHKPLVRRNNDIPLILEIEEKVLQVNSGYKEQINTFDFNLNCDAVSMLIKELDINLVSRFHAMIFSVNVSTPPIVIGWSHKYLEIMNMFNLSDCVIDFSEMEHVRLMELLETYIGNSDSITLQINDNITHVRDNAKVQLNLLTNYLQDK